MPACFKDFSCNSFTEFKVGGYIGLDLLRKPFVGLEGQSFTIFIEEIDTCGVKGEYFQDLVHDTAQDGFNIQGLIHYRGDGVKG